MKKNCVFLSYFIIFIQTTLQQNDGTSQNNQQNINDVENQVINSCKEGCLKCNGTTRSCQICDNSQNYYLNDKNQCIKNQEMENCLLAQQNNVCLKCSGGYYIDNKRCVAVPKSSSIENCLYYSSNNSEVQCMKCNVHFLLTEGSCNQVENKIEGCVEYDVEGAFCLDCQEGQVPDSNFTKCVDQPQTFDNCQKHYFLTCKQCQDNMIIDTNYYQNIDTYSQHMQMDVQGYGYQFMYNIQKQSQIMYTKVCRQPLIQNCLVFKSVYECETCLPQHIKSEDNKRCDPFPEQRIENCQIYAAANSCLECLQGYWKKSDKECLRVLEIPQCKVYSKVLEQVCLQCEDDYYLDGNQCSERKISKKIEFCKKKYLQLDLCEECEAGYFPNIDYSKCLETIVSCLTHDQFQDHLTCRQCDTGFYLDVDKCRQGSLEGCQFYSSNESCSLCQIGYYLTSENKCKEHELSNDISCVEFSTTAQNFCSICLNSRVKFKIANICLAATKKISNCLEYLNETQCKTCDSTKSYLDQDQCIEGNILNCLQYHPTQNQCIRCGNDELTNLGLIPTAAINNNSCTTNNPNIYQFCEKIDDTIQKNCEYCQEGYYPVELNYQNFQYCVPRSYYLFNSQDNLNNCSLYDVQNKKCRHCEETAQGKHLVLSNNTCQESCPQDYAVMTFVFEGILIKQKFVCQNISTISDSVFDPLFGFTCKRFDQNFDENDQLGSFICAECHDGNIPVYQFEPMIQKRLRFAYLLTTSNQSWFSTQNYISSYISCVSSTVQNQTNEQGTKIIPSSNQNASQEVSVDNCKYLLYDPNDGGYFCGGCKHGFTGEVQISSNREQYMIQKCNIMPSCKTDIWLNGLGGYVDGNKRQTKPSQTEDLNNSTSLPYNLDLFLSCHKCNDETNTLIPTFGLAIGSGSNTTDKLFQIKSFGIPTNVDVAPQNVTPISKQTTCKSPGLISTIVFPAGCGVQLLDVTMKLGNYLTHENGDTYYNTASNPICVACKPGFKPTLNSNRQYAIDMCVEIQNCATSNSFNKCEQCRTGFTLDKDSNGQICIQSEVPNCLEGPVTDITNNSVTYQRIKSCTRCMEGFVINKDGYCDLMKTYECKKQGYFQKPTSLEENLIYNLEGIGCKECNDSSIGINFQTSQKICVKNTYLDLSYVPPESTTPSEVVYQFSAKIQNCQNYQLSKGDIICAICKTGFILQSDQKQCHSATQQNLVNCQMAELGGQICKICQLGYYFNVENTVCQEGSLDNCVEYLDQENCLQCKDGFVATMIKGNKTICFDVVNQNCDTFDSFQAISANLICEQCSKGYYQTSDSNLGQFPLNQCLKIPQIEKCEVYNKSTKIVTNSFLTCEKCEDDYYLDEETSTCIERQVMVPNCLEYEYHSDQCSECLQGFYLTQNAQQCKQNPNSTPNCVSFETLEKCSLCDQNMYLRDNKCLEVATENLVTNCLYYRNAFECQQCVKNYYLDQNKCEQALASNCLQVKDSKNCLSCENKYGLSQSQEITSCVYVQVENCEEPDYESLGPQFSCKKCIKGYFLTSSKQCQQVQDVINFCSYYASSSTCSECDAGYILGPNQKKCMTLTYLQDPLDANCSINQLEYTCSVCKEGYIFASNGQCTSCQAGSGCSLCNVQKPSECLICKTGYYQGDDMNCYQLEVEQNVDVVEVVQSSFSYIFTLFVIAYTLLFQFNFKYIIQNMYTLNFKFYNYIIQISSIKNILFSSCFFETFFIFKN